MGLIQKKGDWRGCPESARQRYMAQVLNVNHPDFQEALDEIAELRGRCKATKKGEAMLILGGSGVGKTHLATKLLRASPRDDSGMTSRIPVVLFSIPPKPNESALASELLRSMKAPMHAVGKALDLYNRAIHHINTAQTELVIIDNVHDIPRLRRQRGVEHLGTWIRRLIDEAPCLILLLGTPVAQEVVESNAQLRSRVLRTRHLPYFSIDTSENAARLFRLLAELDDLLPLAERSCIREPKIAQKIYNVTFGVFRAILALLREAVFIVTSQNKETITEHDLADAFTRVYGKTMEYVNVFRENVQNRLLDQKGEPFCNWFDAANASLVERVQAKVNQ
jgi:Bacterial TniB protein